MSLIGLDIGTTGCKAIAFHNDGTILVQASREYFILTPHPGWAEQDAENVFSLTWQCLKEISSKLRNDPPAALAISCQGEAVMPVDGKGTPLRLAILGMDTRTGKQNLWLSDTLGAENLYNRTGMPLHTINTLPKLLWLKENEPDFFQNAHQFLLYEDFLIRRLTGKAVISHCLASRTQIYDLRAGCWAQDILEQSGIDSSRLAELSPTNGGVVGSMLPELCKELGFSNELLIVSGGHDQACAALGSGVIENGKAMVSTGTAEVVEIAMDTPALNSALREGNISVYRHVVPGLFLAMTLNHSGGILFRWYRDSFCEKQLVEAKQTNQDPYDLILEEAPAGPTSLFVLPHFSGSGTPWLDTTSHGAILGLTLSDNRSTVAKAILEGLTFELKINLDVVQSGGTYITGLHAVGGGAKSALWLQLKADICNIPLCVPKVTEAACLGAALLAGTATGIYKNLPDAVSQTVQIKQHIIPSPLSTKSYNSRFETYQKIYPLLKQLNM